MKRIAIIIGLVALMSIAAAFGVAVSQQPPAQPPQLDELDQVRLENLQLRINDIDRDIKAYVALFEATHPGWSINVINGQVFQKPPVAVKPAKPEVKPALTPKK